MESVKRLSKDHDDVLVLLNQLYDIMTKIEGGVSYDEKELNDMVEFFNSSFWLHFDKEEATLFPELSKYLGSSEPIGPIVGMLDEHKELRESNDKLQSLYSEYGDGKAFAIEVRNFIGLLRHHISMEEEMLFPMALNALDRSLDRTWLDKFDEIDKG